MIKHTRFLDRCSQQQYILPLASLLAAPACVTVAEVLKGGLSAVAMELCSSVVYAAWGLLLLSSSAFDHILWSLLHMQSGVDHEQQFHHPGGGNTCEDCAVAAQPWYTRGVYVYTLGVC